MRERALIIVLLSLTLLCLGATTLVNLAFQVTGILPAANFTVATTCPTCVVASSPGVGIAHFAGSTQTVTSSAVNLASADVTGITPPANGGVYNSGTTVGFGGFWMPFGLATLPNNSTTASAGNATSNNVIHWQSFDLYGIEVIGHMTFQVTTLVNPSTVDVGVYSADGQTLKVNMGGVSGATTGNKAAAPGQVTLSPGTYIMAWCGTSSGSIATLGWQAFTLPTTGDNSGTTPIKNANGKRHGTSSAACTAGVLPNSLATLTATSMGDSYPPATWMEP